MGRKGRETRARLLEAALQMLDTTPLRELRSADLARKADISPANFYLYFENMEAVALALSEDVAERALPLIEQLNSSWSWSSDGDDHVEEFVRAYFGFWDAHRSILRIRNLAAEEGNYEFQKARSMISVPLHQALAAKIDSNLAAVDDTTHPQSLALATVALAGLERSAATYLSFPRKFNVTRERLIEACVFSLKTLSLSPRF